MALLSTQTGESADPRAPTGDRRGGVRIRCTQHARVSARRLPACVASVPNQAYTIRRGLLIPVPCAWDVDAPRGGAHASAGTTIATRRSCRRANGAGMSRWRQRCAPKPPNGRSSRSPPIADTVIYCTSMATWHPRASLQSFTCAIATVSCRGELGACDTSLPTRLRPFLPTARFLPTALCTPDRCGAAHPDHQRSPAHRWAHGITGWVDYLQTRLLLTGVLLPAAAAI